MIICPYRLLQRRQVFVDCLHLLTSHEPGNELHVVSEILVPGGSVDYFLVSAKGEDIRDFVGIELQTLDTTGTIWPERQKCVRALDVRASYEDAGPVKPFGMNWKMTAKTILVQLHHKINTFEHINKRLVLVMQDCLLAYFRKSFQFDHISGARLGDSMHFHSYQVKQNKDMAWLLGLDSRLSTDSNGISQCLGLRAETKVDPENLKRQLQKKMSGNTVLKITNADLGRPA